MVDTSHGEAIRPLHYRSRRPGLPVESLPLEALVRRFGTTYLEVTERVSFHLVLLCTGGDGRHHVDFAAVPLRPYRVLHVRPTQVHRWDLSRPYEAQLVVFPDHPGLVGGPRWPVGPAVIDLPERAWRVALQTIALIAEEQETFTGGAEAVQMLEALRRLAVLQLALGRADEATETTLPRAYLAFRDAIQKDPHRSHSVTEYAARLGYSVRTLSRACREARGMTAKQVLDEWIGLEARRLLAGSDLPVSRIATTLGFDGSSNFGKFFHRVVGTTPSTFRWTESRQPLTVPPDSRAGPAPPTGPAT